jgi:hypothetical protein
MLLEKMYLFNYRMRFKYFINVIFVLFCLSGEAQNFYRSYGNTDDEVANSCIETKDSAFFLFGTSSSYLNGTSNFYLLRIDSSGFFNWSKSYGGNGIEQGHSISMKPNGHYLLTGYSNSYGNGGYDILNIEIDSLGNEIWLKKHGGSDWDFAYDNTVLPNGNSIITGSTFSYGNGNQDGFLMMLDNNGDSLWLKTYGNAEENILRKTIYTSTNQLVSIGYTTYPNNDRDFYLVKTNINGDTIWTKKYGTTFNEEGFSLVELPTGNYLIVGYSEGIGSGGKESYYFETDTSGSVMWTQNIGGALNDEFRDVCLKTNSNRFFTAATTESYGNGGNEAKGYLLRYPGGYYVSSNNYGTIMQEELNSVLYTNNKRCLMVGFTNAPYGNKNVLAVLSDTLFPTQLNVINYVDVTSIIENQITSLNVYPNPASDFINFNTIETLEIIITDLSGKVLSTHSDIQNRLDISDLNAGIYILHFTDSNKNSASLKLVISR